MQASVAVDITKNDPATFDLAWTQQHKDDVDMGCIIGKYG